MNSRLTKRILLTAMIVVMALQGAFASQFLDAAPRNIQFANLSTEDGFSSEFVQDLVQDQKGYLWFATQAGLNRFDGHEVKVYEHRSEDPASLGHNFVRALLVDRAGTLWVGTDRGVNTYDPATDSFLQQPFGVSLGHLRVRKIVQHSSGAFWIGTLGSGLIRMDPQTGELVSYTHDPENPLSLPSDNVIDITEDLNGELWIATGNGLARLDGVTGRFRIFRNDPDDQTSISDNDVRSVYQDRSNRIWIGTGRGGLNRFHRDSGLFSHYQHDPGVPRSIGGGQISSTYQDLTGTLWVGTENGLSEWRPAIRGFVNYAKDGGDRKSLVNNRVTAMTQDASGVLWIATHGGVSRWNYISDTFRHFGSGGGYLQSDVVTAMSETSKGVVWIATYGGGVSSLDMNSGVVTHFRHDPNNPKSLSDDRVMTVHVDAQDTVWIGTRGEGLSRLDPDGDFTHFRSQPDNPQSLSGNAVTKIVSTSNGSLWIGIFGGGLNRLHWQDNKPVFERFRHDPSDPGSLSGDRVLTLHEDRQGNLWVGTENAGLNRYVAATNRFESFDVEDAELDDGTNPVSGTPWEINDAADGTMWIGTLGQGLLRWSAGDRATGSNQFQQFGAAEGLASDIYGVVEGASGELWLSSSRGIFRFDPKLSSVRKFDRTNGLRSNEFNLGARLLSRSGQILFGGTDGLLGFHPQLLPQNSRPPAIDIVARSRTDILARTGSGDAPKLELGYFDPFVSFDFVALDFMSPDKNKYRFRLHGYDGDWNDARGLRRAIYSNLPAGSYTFQVQASNSDGVWNRDGQTVRLKVTAPPWQTHWAYIGYALVLIFSSALVLRSHRRRQARDSERQAALERTVNERTAQLAERNEELVALNQRLEQASVTDQLTGLRNRRYVDRFIEAEVAAVQRRTIESNLPVNRGGPTDSSRLLFLLMIDLDGFKQINDSFGHHAGDRALLEVKERLVSCCRESDEVVRWGGDEFLVVGHANSHKGTEVLAEKIRVALADRRYNVGHGCLARLSASIGIAPIPFVAGHPEYGNWTQVVAIADQGAYLAKANGRNAWVSLRGTEQMNETDFHAISSHLQDLVERKKLQISSSIEAGICLDTSSSLPRVAAG